jgi:hypothetical protein
MSPYDGHSRAPLRVGLSIVGAWDAVGLLVQLHGHPHAVALRAVVVVAFVGFVLFASRRATLLGGIVAVAALAVLSESQAAFVGSPMRAYYFSGALTLGWTFGVAFARGLSSLGRRVDGEERFGEIGSVATLAATYAGAASSKLLLGGSEWIDGNHLRAIIASQHAIGDHTILGRYAALVVDHGRVALLLGALAVVVQLGAVALLATPRIRAAWSVLLLAFHLNVWLLAGILYAQATVLVALFGFRVFAPRSDDDAWPEPRDRKRTLVAAVSAAVVLAAVGSLAPVGRYTARRDRAIPSTLDADSTLRADTRAGVRELLGGLVAGDAIAGQRVQRIAEARDGAIDLELARDSGRLVVVVARHRARAAAPPRSSARYDLFYEADPPMTRDDEIATLDATLDAVLARIVAHESVVPMPQGL